MAAEIGYLGGVKASPVEIQAMNGGFALRRRGLNLRPVAVGVAPEVAPPGVVQRLQRLIARLQPVAELLLA